MGGSRVQVNKQHKTRFASKSSRNVHKIPSRDKAKSVRPERNALKGARNARLQRNKMAREEKKAALLKEKREGSKAPPRVIVLFGLSASLDLCSLEQDILTLLSAEGTSVFPAVASSEFKLRATVLKAPHGDLLACMEMAKVADLIAFVASVSASSEEDCRYIDRFGYHCLSVFRAIGLPSTAVLIRDLPSELKRKQELKKSCISSLSSEFPEACKFYPADTREELHKFMWLFKEQRLTSPHWRNQRPYVMAQKVDFVADESTTDNCTLLLTGYVRARGLSINQLVHVSGIGDFQFSKIELLKDPCCLNARKGDDLMESDDITDTHVVSCLTPDPLKQDPLIVENVPDPLAGEQTWPTEAEMAEAERDHKEKKKKPKTLPHGTSDYQAAWIVNDSDSEHSETEEDDSMVLENGEDVLPNQREKDDFAVDEDQTSISMNSDEETDTDSVFMETEKLTTEQIEDDIKKIKAAHAEDEEFPDEVDTPLDVPARKRFAKYRGLKSFRTSSWDPKESLPPEYARIFAFDNFNRTQKHVLAKAQDTERNNATECIVVGSYVRLHISGVPIAAADKLCMLVKTMPVISCGLLQHESKISVLHFSVKKHDSYTDPIKSKEELLFHVGFRQFVARPIYSSDNITSDKHKMERFLHAGRFSIASVYAPISFPPLPLIALKTNGEATSPAVAAIGSLRCIDPDRIILKKIILTGYPLRVSKMKASVRYMFHTPEDVRWFKPVEVWTKHGRRGRVKEPLGTHGAMKCVFNGVLQQHDTVCMSLFKRAYPNWPKNCYPLQLAAVKP